MLKWKLYVGLVWFWVKVYFLEFVWGKLFGGTVPPNNSLFGGTVPPNNSLFGRTVPPNNSLFGGTVPPDNSLFGRTIPPNNFLFDRISLMWSEIVRGTQRLIEVDKYFQRLY